MKIKMRAEYPDAKLQPDKRITILLLGETGVGKSTFVNGIINYPRFESLPETEEDFKRLIWAIGMKYDYTDENYNTVTVSVGRFSDSENINNLGASVTQDPKVHVFTTQGMEVHLIDTPGIGDTAGYEQDKRNCAKIIDFVKDYEIHGICMLLKPNSSRLNIFFRFCLEELLVHLPVDATRNIIFCFTNARSTLYRVGDTFAPLKGLLEERKVDIPLTQDRIYLFDNEAIRFLTARVNGIEFPPDEVESFRESWDRAAKELTRAISFMAQCIPQSGQAIKKLNDVRRVVVSLSVPMAEIAQIIQRNIDFQNRRRDELAMLTGEENDLQERLKMEIVDYVVTMYDQPRTVCTTCANYVDISGSRHVVFEKACHDPCYLDSDTVPAAVVGHPGLLHCAAIGSDNDCLECGHSYLEHMHTMSKAEPKVVVTDNPQVVEKLKTASERRNVIDEEIQRAVDTREEYEHEYKIVMEISVRFTQYINKNAILNFNSSLGDYLQMQIKKLEDMHDRSELDDKCLANYKTSLLRYEEEAKIFQAAVNEGQASVPTSSEIEALVQKLKDLRLTGKIFKDVFQANESLFNCYDGTTSITILPDSQALMSNAPDSWHLKIDLTPTSTTLMKAAYKGEKKKVNSLLKAGCNQLRCQDKNGCTALMCAAEQGHESIVKSLIDHEHGLRDSRGHTALMYAASNGHLDAVKLLIECEGNIVNNNDCKALLYALKNRHTKIINILLPHEDPVYTRGCTLLMEAAARGDMDTLRLLLSQAREIGQNGMTALMHAAQAGQAQAVQELLPLESGMKNKDGVTALMLGASEGHTAVVRLLAPHEKGIRNNAGSTALVIALQHGFEDIVEILVAEEDPTSPTGETALMRAAGRGDIDIVHLLVPLQKGLQDNRGRVALMYAIEHGHLSAAEAL
ncbi:Ankyrin repeat protein, partial [Giardia lamblia P15]